jgi:(S)-ureidoglycine aminohydrolase
VTRGRRGACWTLLTPDNHYVSRLADLQRASVVKLVTPRLAPARFGQYLVQMPPTGGTDGDLPEGFEHFLYCLDGELTVTSGTELERLDPGGWAYLPPDAPISFAARRQGTGALALWLKRPYEVVGGFEPPSMFSGQRDDGPFAETATPGVRRRELLPVDDPAFDFAMSVLAFDPGAGLAQVEIHDEEHGLWMTAGGGTYHLDGEDLEVERNDFIYMAPYCPQSFVAGPDGAEYLLYKDAWRDGFPFG